MTDREKSSDLASDEGLDETTGEWGDAVDRWGESALPADREAPPSAEHAAIISERSPRTSGSHQAVPVEPVLHAANEAELAELLERLAETGALDLGAPGSWSAPPAPSQGPGEAPVLGGLPHDRPASTRAATGGSSGLFGGIEQDYRLIDAAHAPLPPVPPALLDYDRAPLASMEQVEPITFDSTYWERLEGALTVQAQYADSATVAAELEFSAARAAEQCGQGEEVRQRYAEVLSHRPHDLAALLALWRLDGNEPDPDRLPNVLVPLADTLTRQGRSQLSPMLCDLAWVSEHGPPEEAQRLLAEENQLRPLLSRAAWACSSGATQQFTRVLQKLTALLDTSSDHAALALQVARHSEAERDYPSAAAGYKRAVNLDPSQLGGWDGLSRMAVALEDPEAATQAVLSSAHLWGPWAAHRSLRRGPWAGDAQLEQGTTARQTGLLDRADVVLRDPLVVDALKWTYLQQGDAAKAITLLEDSAQTLLEQTERAHALVQAAEIASAIGDLDRANGLLERSLDHKRDYAPAIAILAHIALRQADSSLMARGHAATAEALEGPARAAHLLAASHGKSSGPQDKEARFESLASIVQLDPLDQRVVLEMDRLARSDAQRVAYAVALEQAATACADSERAAELLLWAGTQHERQGRFEDALDRFRQALQGGRDADGARAGVMRALAALGRWSELAELCAASAVAADSDSSRLAHWSTRAELLIDAAADARSSYDKALSINPDEPRALWGLALLETAEGDWSAAESIFERMAQHQSTDGLAAAARWLRLAMLRERQFKAPETAVGAYEDAIGLGLAAARDGLSRCWVVTGQVLDNLRARLGDCSCAEDRFALLTAMGARMARTVETRSPAKELLLEALRLRPDHSIAVRQLASIYRAAHDWDGLADLARHNVSDVSPDGEQRRHDTLAFEQLGELALQEGSIEAAAQAFDAVLALDPGGLNALRVLQLHAPPAPGAEAALRLLRREAEATSSAVDGPALWTHLGHLLEVAQRASLSEERPDEAYERAFRLDPRGRLALIHLLAQATARSDTAAEADIYERLASVSDDGDSAAVYYAHAARLRGHDLQLYRAALRSRPTHLSAIIPLRLQAERAGDARLLFETAAAQARATRVPARAIASHREAARAAGAHLDDSQAETEHLWRIVELDASDQEAFERLSELLRQQQRWTDLAVVLQRAIEAEPHTSRRSGLHRALAELASVHGTDPGLAKQQLQELLSLSPQDTDALRQLADIHEAERDWELLAETLLRQAEAESDPPALLDVLLRLAQTYCDKLEDKPHARLYFEQALRIDPSNRAALIQLSRLHIEDQNFEQALTITQRLCEIETDRNQLVDHLLLMAKILEDGLRDSRRAAQAFRKAVEAAPSDLKAIGALCGFHARQGDQRSVTIHLDTALSTMRERLAHDPFEPFAAHAMFKIFGWRRSPDGVLCAAQLLDSLGHAGAEEIAFIDSHRAQMERPDASLASEAHDDLVFAGVLPGGFRQIFRLLEEPLSRSHRAELRSHGVSRADRLGNAHHPVRAIGDALAADFGVDSYDLYLVDHEPMALIVENTEPPSIIVGSSLMHNATEEEVHFLLGRCLWLIRKAMVLPARLVPRDLEVLLAAVIRLYRADFAPPGVDERALQMVSRQVSKASRKLRQTLMPFALECSGSGFDAQAWGAAVVHSANRAGLVACRSTKAAFDALCRAAGQARADSRPIDNPEAEELLRFAVSAEYLQLRKNLGIAVD